MKEKDYTVVWQPQAGPQEALIACPIFEVFFGGARGGGKTEGSIGDWLDHSNTYGQAASGVFFRRASVQLEEVIARTHEIFPSLGASFNVQKSTWTMRNGARLKFRYLERDTDAQEYQGHSYTRVYVEEATNFPSPSPINKLRATLRSARGVQVGMRLTGNPGGPGHNWVYERYIQPNPAGWETLVERIPTLNGNFRDMERIFIPSKLIDNKLLLAAGDQYVAQLRQSGSEQLVRAWLDGDWTLVDGAFFDNFKSTQHVVLGKHVVIPPRAERYRSMDWGYAKPFCVHWFVVADGTWGPDGFPNFPRESLYVYREWYGWNGKVNTGLRLEADEVALGIKKREVLDGIGYGVCDPSMYIRDGGPAIAETMAINGVSWRRGDNRRQPGWQEVRRRLKGKDGVPLLYFNNECTETIRTIKTVQHDETNVEDLDTDGEDHAVDSLRYGCMARPSVQESIEAPEAPHLPKLPQEMTIAELISRRTQARQARESETL